MKKYAVIFGSSRSNGNTMRATSLVLEELDGHLLIDLSVYQVHDFDYQYTHDDDDFLKIITSIIEYDVLIFATPIYWYTMSAPMKRFVDRFTELLTIHKELGRALRGKKFAVICSYGAPEGIDGFERIFINTANYLAMQYLGCYFHYSGDLEELIAENLGRRSAFIHSLKNYQPK